MATMAGPGLREPPRNSTTRMTANSTTTDSEMATTDHTLGRSALPARGPSPHPRWNHRATNAAALCGD
ncbi:hypothetical protein GCM10018787_52970 [Streptomyces thermodiastaticus]|nr:hypothetical protein GCM10018787_52970 [Streptomyces thermodiastaticus]